MGNNRFLDNKHTIIHGLLAIVFGVILVAYTGLSVRLLAISFPEIQERKDPFSGIEDEKVLPMLRNLPTQHGGGNIPAIDGRFLYDLITEKGYKRGLEIGTSNGYSSLWIGLALKQNNGSLLTLEINPLVSEEARGNFEKAGLDEVI